MARSPHGLPCAAAAILVHLLLVLALALAFAILFLLATGSDLAAFLRSLAALPGQVADERTRRYVLCLAVPLVGLPLAVALWCTPDVRAGRLRPGHVLGRALLCGFAATVLFWLSVEVALATAARRPSVIARFTLRQAWMFVLLWSFVHAVIACIAHATTVRMFGPRIVRPS